MRSETYAFIDCPLPATQLREMEKVLGVVVLKSMIGTNGYERLEVIFARGKRDRMSHSFTVRLIDKTTGLVPVCAATGKFIFATDDEVCQALLAVGWPFKHEKECRDYNLGVRRFFQIDNQKS